MEIERAGITFDVTYYGGTRGGLYEPPESASIEIGDWHVSDWDELAACYGTGSGERVFASVEDIAEDIMERDYDEMLSSVEQDIADDFDPPDDDYDDGDYLW